MTSTLDHPIPGRLAITAEQRRRFDVDGFFIVEDALTTTEVDQLVDVVDAFADGVRRSRGLPAHAPVRVRNIVARHLAFLDLLDHPTVLPLVVDVLGPGIQLRGSNLDVRPPAPPHDSAAPDFATLWHRDEPAGGWPTVDGIVPFLEIKVGFYLTDLTHPASGALRIIPGSHRLPAHTTADVEPVEITVAPGSALIWRTSLLHDVGPNHTDRTRKCLYLAYQHRWLRPSDYITAPADLLARCNPIQRQLLGSLADPSSFVKDADVEPCSTYWTPSHADLPLLGWAQQHGYDPDQPANHDVTTTDNG
jgi:ectoine hydroxylase-related dioxygenase (phytanoyl-CoA dioxygenase family)